MFGQLVQLGELILRERLGRKQIQRARRRIRQDRLKHRRVVAERLARRRRRRHDDVAAGEGVLDGRGLMRVELVDAASGERCAQPRVERVGQRRKLCGLGGQTADRRHPAVGRIRTIGEAASREPIQGGRECLLPCGTC